MKTSGAVLAVAVAGMLVAMVGCAEDDKAAEPTGQGTQLIKCEGGNSCMGLGSCEGKNPDGTSHDCAGKGSCAAQGWIETKSQAECDKAKAAAAEEAKKKMASSGGTETKAGSFKCEGGNSCKGLGECAGKGADGVEHGCAGKGGCAGQGFITTKDEAECEAAKAANG